MGKSRRSYSTLIIACLITLAFAAGWLGTKVSAQASATGDMWQKIPSVPSNIDFRNVFMASARSGIAVGKQDNKGVAYQLDWMALDGWRNSLQMTVVNFQFRAPLWAAVIVNEDVWAVGEQGLIVHEQNGVWSEVASPVPDAQLLTLQMLGGGEEGWAGGFRPRAGGGKPEPVILHYANGQWQRDDSVTGEGSINALHFAQNGGWAVGDAGIWRYSKGKNGNGGWTKEQEPDPCPDTGCFQTYSAVRAITDDEAWIAGSSIGLCGICVPRPYLLHRESGRWQIAVDGSISGDPTREGLGRELYGLTFTNDNPNVPLLWQPWAVGTIRDNNASKPYILTHRADQDIARWDYVPYPAGIDTQLTSVSTPDSQHAMAVGTGGAILTYGYGPQPPPTLTATPTSQVVTRSTPVPTAVGGSNATRRVSDPHSPDVTYYAPVGHTLRGKFREYWQQHGGLPQFGYPLTEEFTEVSPTDGKSYTTQYFERARFEYHPENQAPSNVLLGLLGRTITQGRENEQPFRPVAPTPAKAGALYFSETGHSIAPEFSGYWLSHGGLSVYGFPISEAFTEVSTSDGKQYLVQYFERNRLEYHPELPEAFRVSLGLLGAQVLQERGWLTGP